MTARGVEPCCGATIGTTHNLSCETVTAAAALAAIGAARVEIRTMNPRTPRAFDRAFLYCPRGHEVVSAPVTTRTGARLVAGDYSGESCGYIGCGWSA